MKTSRLLMVVVALVVAGSSYWLLRDRAPEIEAVTKVDSLLPLADAPVEPTRAEVEAPKSAATEAGSVLAASPPAASSPERTQADLSQLEVLLLDPEGNPLVDARIALFREQRLLAQGITDSEGLASWPAQQVEAQYAIAAWGWEVARGELELSAGRKTITLAAGASIAGTALVDGATAKPFELRWSSKEAAGDVRLPMSVHTALRRPGSKHSITVALTQADGSFRFRGVREGASGQLLWSAPYFLRDVEHERSARLMKLDAPRQDLVLDLTEGCELQLRVVDPKGNPVPGAAVRVERVAKLPSGEERNWTDQNQPADSEGRYRQALSPARFEECTVKVAAPNTTAWKAYQLTPPTRLIGVWDVGDLAANDVRTLLVRVQNAQGAAIEGASVYSWPSDGARRESKSDADGKLVLVIDEKQAVIATEAFTYASELAKVPPEAKEITVTMQRCCTLEFELSDPARDREGLSIELSGPAPMLEGYGPGSEGKRPRTSNIEGGGSSSAGSEGRQAIIVPPHKDTRWRITGLLPHQTLHARLNGAGTLVCEFDVPPLAPGEQRSVTLPLPPARNPLVVRVLSPDLKPVPSAIISTEFGDVVRVGANQPVDEKGELTFAWLQGERFDFAVTAKDLPPKRFSLSPIPEGRFDVVLDPPQSLEVELVRRDGTPYLGRVRFGSDLPGSLTLEPTRVRDGLYRLDAMPAGEILLTIQGDFPAVHRFHRAGDPSLRVVIDAPGSIEVTFGPHSAEAYEWILEIAAPGSARGIARSGLEMVATKAWRATIHSLPFGEYDLWLVHGESMFAHTHVREGSPVRIVLDAAHPSAKLDMEFPR